MNVSFINRSCYPNGLFFRQSFLKPLLNVHKFPWGMKYKIDSGDLSLLKNKKNENALTSQNAKANSDTKEVGPSAKKLDLGPTKVKESKKVDEIVSTDQKGEGLSVEEKFGVFFYETSDEDSCEQTESSSQFPRKRKNSENDHVMNEVPKKAKTEESCEPIQSSSQIGNKRKNTENDHVLNEVTKKAKTETEQCLDSESEYFYIID